MTAAPTYAYLGADERVYAGYLQVLPDGGIRTLYRMPGGDPVVIQRASGDEVLLPETPTDGLWTVVEPAPAAASAVVPVKGQKAQPPKTQDA